MSNFKEKNIELEVALLKMSKVKRENLCVEVALAKMSKVKRTIQKCPFPASFSLYFRLFNAVDSK